MGTHRLATQRTRVIMKFFTTGSALHHPGSRLCSVPSCLRSWPWLRSPRCLRRLRCRSRSLPRCCCCLPRCCSHCRCCCSCCGRCCSCCSRCSHRPLGDQQPVQGRGRGRQHCLWLPEHQQRRRAARNCQRQRCHRQRVLRCRRLRLPCDRTHQEVCPVCPCCLRWTRRRCHRPCCLRRPHCSRCRCCPCCRPCS